MALKDILIWFKSLWFEFAGFVGKMFTNAVLSLLYIFVIGLFSILARFFSRDDFKRLPKGSESYWQPIETEPEDLYKHQF